MMRKTLTYIALMIGIVSISATSFAGTSDDYEPKAQKPGQSCGSLVAQYTKLHYALESTAQWRELTTKEAWDNYSVACFETSRAGCEDGNPPAECSTLWERRATTYDRLMDVAASMKIFELNEWSEMMSLRGELNRQSCI
jgi:hypothetical protein